MSSYFVLYLFSLRSGGSSLVYLNGVYVVSVTYNVRFLPDSMPLMGDTKLDPMKAF